MDTSCTSSTALVWPDRDSEPTSWAPLRCHIGRAIAVECRAYVSRWRPSAVDIAVSRPIAGNRHCRMWAFNTDWLWADKFGIFMPQAHHILNPLCWLWYLPSWTPKSIDVEIIFSTQLIFFVSLSYIGLTDATCGYRIRNGSSKIESPHFGKEYGETANCSWQFDNIEELQLKLTDLKIACTDNYSYRLVINQG